jgi:hypothetical protein
VYTIVALKNPIMHTSTRFHIQNEKSSQFVEDNRICYREGYDDFVFYKRADPLKTPMTYSWKNPNISDGIPVELTNCGYGPDTDISYLWLDKDEIASNPLFLEEYQSKIQEAINRLVFWNCQSVSELESAIDDFIDLANGHIFSTCENCYSFRTPWMFALTLNIPTAIHLLSKEHRETTRIKLENKYGSFPCEFDCNGDLDGNLLIRKEDKKMLRENLSLAINTQYTIEQKTTGTTLSMFA